MGAQEPNNCDGVDQCNGQEINMAVLNNHWEFHLICRKYLLTKPTHMESEMNGICQLHALNEEPTDTESGIKTGREFKIDLALHESGFHLVTLIM